MNLIHIINGVSFKEIAIAGCFVNDYAGSDIYMKTRSITDIEGHPINAVSIKDGRFMWFKDTSIVYPATTVTEYDY